MKSLSQIFLVSIIVLAIFISGLTTSALRAEAGSMSLAQLIELLITTGVIPADKVTAARAVGAATSSVSTFAPAKTTVSTSTSYIQVLNPNGGQSWDIDVDVPYTITWGSTGLSQARVALVSTVKKIGTCELAAAPVTSKNGDNSFKVLLKKAQCFNLLTGTSTPLLDGSYKARVYYTQGSTTIADESNAVFKIVPKPIPSLKVAYPNGTETLVRNREYDVKYTLKNAVSKDGLIYLYLLDNMGNTVYNSHKVVRSDGKYTLDLPSSLSAGSYKIKLKMTTTERVEIEDVSDNFFWISSGL